MERSLAEAPEVVRELRPSIVVAGKKLGVAEVLEFLRLIQAENLSAAMIVRGSPLSESEALRYLQTGASGVIRKTASLDDFGACIQAVSTGASWMESQILRDSARPMRIAHSLLTARESQVMSLVARI
jgi:DNA-binding NarL/FixJ family response regulator